MEYIAIIAFIVVVLAIVFLRKKDDDTSDYVEPTFKASGKKWVFNGSLDIDNPPAETSPFDEGEIQLQLMVKKGFVHYELKIDEDGQEKLKLGMFRGRAYADKNGIRVFADECLVGTLPQHLTGLCQIIANKEDGAEAYGFIARRNDKLWGEVCVKK